METALPEEMEYSRIKPVGWYSKFKEWPVEPLSSNMYWWPNEIIRFQFQLTNGVMDPYRSHLAFTVSSPNSTDMPVGGIQVDNSAQSFISTMVITSKNAEIERILQYDTLAAYLTDLGFSEIVSENRETEGLGYSNFEVTSATEGMYGSRVQPTSMWNGTSNVEFPEILYGHNSIMPTKCYPSDVAIETRLAINNFNVGNPQNFGSTAANNSNANYLQYEASLQNTLTPSVEAVRSTYGYFSNLRAEYNTTTRLRNYIDSTTSAKTDCVGMPIGVIPSNFKTGATMPSGMAYKPFAREMVYQHKYNATAGQQKLLIPNIAPLLGYSKPYSSKFSIGCNEPMLSPTILQNQFGYGLPSSLPVPLTMKKFQIPLLSAVIGVLIQADQFRLLPLKALYDMIIELTLNPYAMFTTGRSDVHEFDTVGALNQIKRDYTVSRMYYNLHIYEWPQQYMAQHIEMSLNKEILITSSSWALSGQYQIATGQQVASNSWQIATGPESLAEIVCLFISNEYLKYTYCRKQFRLSNNIRTMQVKHNIEYFPPQPVQGNAGNPENIDNSGDNYDFYEKLLTANNYKFVTNVPLPRINTFNFAVNGRVYDPTRTTSLYDPAMSNNINYVWTASSVNTDTAMGFPSFHENRCVGRAAFVTSFQPPGHSTGSITGLDTKESRPMEVNFDVHPTNFFPTDQTLYIFTRANVAVTYSSNGISVQGR